MWAPAWETGPPPRWSWSGPDCADSLAALLPPRREGAYVVCEGPAPHQLFEQALRLGAESVVSLPTSQTWLVEVLTDAGDLAPTRGRTISVIGGAGGAGSTTFACALGQVLARQSSVLMLDADPQGPGLDRVLGMEDLAGVRWDSLMHTTGRLSARSLADAVPRRRGLGVVTWPAGARGALPVFGFREVLSAGVRGHGHVVIDLPRAPGPLAQEAFVRSDHLVMVVSASLTGLASAAQVAARLPAGTDTGLVVRGEAFTAAEVTAAVGLPVWAMMRDQRGLTEAIDLGLGPVRGRRGALTAASREVLDGLALREAA
jgi:secretion/DNA translocation related CpaE-like protein